MILLRPSVEHDAHEDQLEGVLHSTLYWSWYNVQVGDEVPDVASSALKGAWEATQQLLRQRKISAGHDISDGGIATALLEMSFSGNTGISVISSRHLLTSVLCEWAFACDMQLSS